MNRVSRQFVESDSWILLSIVHACRGEQLADLSNIIDRANAIMHAMPTVEELDGALNRLIAAGFVDYQRGILSVTEKTFDVMAKVSKLTSPVLRVVEDITKLFACPCFGPKLRSVRRRLTITKTDINKLYTPRKA